jgi:peroxiredoxin
MPYKAILSISMKKFAAILLLLLPAARVLGQSGTFVLKGSITHTNGTEKAFLMYRNGDEHVTDSVTLTNGTFEFKGTIEAPTRTNLWIGHKAEGLETLRRQDKVDILSPYLEPGNIVVKGTDSIYNASVTGGQTNKDSQELLGAIKPFDIQTNQVEAEENAVPKEKRTPQLQADYEKRYAAIEAGEKKALGAFMELHTASWVSLDALQSYGGSYPEASDLEPLFNTFSPQLKNSAHGKYYSALIVQLKLTAIGAKAPVFAQKDKDGKSISIASFKGKYVLIDFWASWCGPCRIENPNVVKAYKRFKDKNFTILGVSLDRETGRERWLKAIADDGLVWTQVSDLNFWNNQAAVLYGVNSIPQNFLINPDGKIIAKNLLGKDLIAKLNEIFAVKSTVSAGAKNK